MADKLLNVEIVTPEKILFTGKAVSVSVPGSKSPFQVLYNHAPIVSSLDIGEIKIVDESQKSLIFASSPGFTEVRKNKVSILVESAVDASALDGQLLMDEVKSAKEKIQNAADKLEAEDAKKELKIAENSLKVFNKFKG